MRAVLPDKLEGGRVRHGRFASTPDQGCCGLFFVQGPCGCELKVIGHPREEWEHVSVSTDRHRCPNWQEMCFVKDLFWDEEECVVQYHPPLSQYVKNNRYCLHLWKLKGVAFPMPPSTMVGIVGLDPEQTRTLLTEMGLELEPYGKN